MAIKTAPSVTVTGANTATKLTANRQPAHVIYVYAFSSNAAPVWVGDSAVSSSPGSERGFSLAAGGTQQFVSEIAPNDLDLSTVFVASTSNSAKVGIVYIEG